MATAIKVKLNTAGIGELLKSAPLRSDLTARMERVLSAAKSGAPVASGTYRDSLRIEQATTDRAVVHVVSDVSYAMAVEARTGNLARALDQAGGG